MRSTHVADVGISIRKRYRDEGIGTKLLEILIAEAKKAGHKVLVLTLFEINKRAHAVYKKLGFKDVGVIPEAYSYKGKYEDEIVMYKKL